MERIKKNTGKNGTDKRIYCGSNKAFRKYGYI